MRFANPAWFVLLLVIPLLHRWWKRRNEPPELVFPIEISPVGASLHPQRWLLVLRYLGLVFLTIALARPQSSFQKTERQVSGLEIMMVMDVSASMNIEDLADRPRLDIAKQTMRDFIKGRTNDRIGFAIFSGEPLTLVPPTLDYGILAKAISDVEIGILKDGTAIGDGLSMAVARLKNSKAKSRVVILLTDGDNNVGQVDPATAGDLAAGYGIKVYTIAIGREGRVKMPFRRKGLFGKTITTYQWFENALNPELLEHIAKITSGKFYRVTDASTLSSVFKEIDQLEKTEMKVQQKTRFDEKFQTPLLVGALLILLELLLKVLVWRAFP